MTYFTRTTRSYFRFAPPPSLRDKTASSNSPPPGPKGWTCPRGCQGGMVTGKIEPCITTTFSVRFHSPSSKLKSYCSFNPLWTMNTTIFQETSNLYHILEPIFGRLFQKIILGCSLRSSFIDPFSFVKKRCNTVLAPFSFSHVIDYFAFFLSRFFLSFFLDLYGN